ncbi:MAG: flotillin family protein [Deltaproteobacteria bacterium]|nr:flotillin family protein [Deltaproteobacteria bacterium]
MTQLIIVSVCLILAVLGGIAVYVRLLEVCPPNQVLIFYGDRRRVGAREFGYRVLQGGSALRKPLFERVARMDLTNMIIEIRVAGAYSKGGIPLNVEGVANVKVASVEPIIANAIERFLDRDREDIMRIARETLEGNLRGVLATLTPEEVNQDRVKFAESLLHEADYDLRALGLELDTLKIQTVSDEKGYLDSLGRKQSADLVMRSRIAEADNHATAQERSAENLQNQSIARVNANIEQVRAEARRRIIDARTRRSALVAEQKSAVTSAVARAHAEMKVQEARQTQVKLKLLADKVRPAEAQKEKMEAEARGTASLVIEEGKAAAEALRALSSMWAQSGEDARQILVAQKLNALIAQLMSTVGDIGIDKVTVIDRSLAGSGDGLASRAAILSEQLKHTLGIDVPRLLAQWTPDAPKLTGAGAGRGTAEADPTGRVRSHRT